ncbi:hypothetical protein F5Y15DRAFT_398616 [Xylariaceae sp. FL0016]|nr:hypothetical protein F5Y15DRAFT_398616 [Xylariaceae sp. FL0016]
MSLQRSATRKAGAAPARHKKDYDVVKQGIKELYPLDKSHVVPEVDIVFVPGLGANPEESWVSASSKYNWTTDGLVRDFPKARILLYMYESAWTGSLKVKQFMSNIAMSLLTSLKSKREGCQRRPIVFIGHSMGGLVIAKAITIADSRRDKFPIMFEAIAASIFFGTPFNGAAVASVAAMYAHLAEKVGQATASKLLDLMKPGDETLRELRHEFMRLAGKLSPKIDLLCFYEEQPTDFSKMAGLPSLFGLSKLAIPSKYAEFVSRDSATLPGVDEYGLACNHRDLVKFDSPKDDRWSQLVRDPLKKVLHGAQLAVKNRLNSVRDIDRTMISNIMDALDGVQLSQKRRTLLQTFSPSSWITKEAEYLQWLSQGARGSEAPDHVLQGDCLWIRGPEGRGKTSASMAAVEEIEKLIRANEDEDTGQDPVLLAYFFCDTTPDSCTPEDLLKSLIRQLISQQETLAPYAKMFAKKSKQEGNKAQAQVTVENLWQSLQDMLTDEFIGSKVIFVLNNLHALPEDSDSTIKLMKYLNSELQNMSNHAKRVPTRWFVTSREAHNIGEAFKVDGIRLVDLEDEKYGDQVQMALRKHAKNKVASLKQEKKYNTALAYFASSLIGKRAQNTQWIDITCVQLEELPEAESDLSVRKVLETMPQDLRELLNNAWLQVFHSNTKSMEKIKEILRALVLTYEDPSETELGVLSGLCSSEDEKTELHELIEKCKPLLSIKRDGTVCFINIVVKTHLLENAKALLGLSKEEMKWQHGVLALRSFTHVQEKFDFEPEPEPEPVEEPEDHDSEAASEADDDEDDEPEDEDEDDKAEDENAEDEQGEEDDDDDNESDSASSSEPYGEPDPEAPILEDRALPYTVKYWLRHASKATLEIAEDLSLEENFWKRDSRIRRRWLVEYCRMTHTFDIFDPSTFSGLHIAASVGFRQLVAALIRNGYQDEIHVRDSLVNTPLHFAAHYGRPKIVEELLNKGAAIDDGDELGEETPLHMAAFGGHVEVMRKLVLRGANPNATANATANDIGPVVNAAICSGNRAAVELLVEHGVKLAVDRDDVDAPLALAAYLSDVSMFEYLIQQYADKLSAEEYSKALVKAAEAGRIEVFNKLLAFEHDQGYFQKALDVAVQEWNWDIVTIILERRHGLDCNGLFYEAATGTEPQDRLLELSWNYTGGNISPETLNKSLYDATDREKDETVQVLLEKYGANANATGEEYGNALTAAAYDGTMHIIQLLLNAGADINASEGWAIQAAAAEGHYEVVEELVKRGADVNAMTRNENFVAGTALQGACEADRVEVVTLLLEHGANPNLGSGEDSPPIIAATMRSEEEILELLVKAKADLDVFGGYYTSTPLINAAAYMPVSSIQLLLDAGSDINLTDKDGDTALIAAARRGDEDAVTFLLDNGADLMHSNNNDENALQIASWQEDNEGCLRALVERVSVLFASLKTAIRQGNTSVAGIVRNVASTKQGLSYDDDTRTATHDDDDDQRSVDEDDHQRTSTHSGAEKLVTGAEQQESAHEDVAAPASFDLSETFGELSAELKSALGNQAALFGRYTSKPAEDQPIPVGSNVHEPQPMYRPAAATSQQWTHKLPADLNQSAESVSELPAQGVAIRRKPAPRTSYDGNSPRYSHTPSPKPLNAGYQVTSTNGSSNQVYSAYQPPQEGSQYRNQSQSMASPPIPPKEPASPPPQNPVAYPGIQAYQPSQSSHSSTPSFQNGAQFPSNSNSHYDGAGYGNNVQYTAPPPSSAPQQTYAAYHPDSYPNQQSPNSNSNNVPPVQAYQNQLYQGQASQYQDYYGGGGGDITNNSTTTADPGSVHPHNVQQYDEQMYGGADWERPQMPSQRSSFFSKTTLDKAKLMSGGMFGRK